MILNSHPDIAIYGEIHYFDEISKLLPDAKETDIDTIDHFLNHTLRRAYHVRLLPKLDPVLGRVRRRLQEGASLQRDFYRLLMESFAEIEGKSRYGEKTNENIRYLDELIALFPDARIIHIVRDPRDVVASMMSMPWASNDVLANTLRWRAEIANACRHREDTSRFYEIRYEDLIENPENICREICDFVGVPFVPEMLDYHRKAGDYIVNEPWKQGTEKHINSTARQRWRRDLTQWQVCLIQCLVGRYMAYYGYNKVGCGLLRKLAVPAVLSLELFKYLRYKINQRKRRKMEGSGVIYGDDVRLYRLLWQSFTKSGRGL